MARATSSTMVSGSSIYAYVEVDGITHHSNRTTMNVRGGVTSDYYWDINCESRGKWWEGGTTYDATGWSGSQHYGGYGDLQLLSTTYTFDRYSYNRTVSAGCESWCSLGSATAWIDDITIPALPPSATTLTANRASDNKVSLSWTNAGGVKQAVCIERQVDGGAWGEIQVVWNGSATSWADTTTSAGHSYSYRFRYYNVNAYGSYSNVQTITMTPSAPQSISVAASGGTNVTVTLANDSAVATSLEYQTSTDGGSTWSASTTVSGSPVTSFSTSVSGTALIRVRNKNATGVSDWLVSDPITTICPPAPPTLRTPSGSVYDMALGDIEFSWLHNSLDGSTQTAYQLRYAINGGAWTTLSGTTAQSCTVSIGTFSAGNAVTWQVRTKGADANYSDWSQTGAFSVYTAPTLSITSLGATITSMPIALTATYSDMTGFTCQAATVSLQKDGRTLYSEPATISGSSITASLTTDEFLPTNGESYTVVLTARSSSSLQTTANATFTVDFVEPQAGELNITNDPDTGYVSLLATFDNSASEITYTGSTNEQYDSTDGYVRSLTVEGKSEKWNQHGRFVKLADASTDKWGSAFNSFTVASDGLSASVSNTRLPNTSFGISAEHRGHKLYFSMDVAVTGMFTNRFVVNFGGTIMQTALLLPNVSNHITAIGTMGTSYNSVYIYPNGTADSQAVTCDYTFANFNLVDLTAMFGAGNEPATVDAFKATDIYKAKLAAGELYDYDAGSLVSIDGAGVRGRNLLPKLTAGTYTNNGVTIVVDDDGVATMSGTTTASGNAVIIPFESPFVVTDGLYLQMNNSVANASAAPSFESNSAVSAFAPAFAPTNRIFTVPSSAVGKTIERIRLWLESGVTISGTFAPMLSTSSTATAYEPYSLTTITTPLRSAGSVHDELQADADSWTVERRVGVVDLGTLTWTSPTTGIYYGSTVPNMKKGAWNNNNPNNCMVAGYTALATKQVYEHPENDMSVALWDTDGRVGLRNNTIADAAALSTSLSGVYLFYELATPTQDTETSMSRIEIGSAFTVATDLDSTFSMTTWDGSADAVSVSVSRVNTDGTITPLLTDGASGSGLVDRYAPLNVEYKYAVTTKASSKAVKTVYVANTIRTTFFFVYWDDHVARAIYNPENDGVQITRPQKTRVYYAGRKDPVSYDGEGVSLSESPSWMIIGIDERDQFVQLIEDGGRGVYKSGDGFVYHADFGLTLNPSYTALGYYGGLRLDITRIAGEKL